MRSITIHVSLTLKASREIIENPKSRSALIHPSFALREFIWQRHEALKTEIPMSSPQRSIQAILIPMYRYNFSIYSCFFCSPFRISLSLFWNIRQSQTKKLKKTTEKRNTEAQTFSYAPCLLRSNLCVTVLFVELFWNVFYVWLFIALSSRARKSSAKPVAFARSCLKAINPI